MPASNENLLENLQEVMSGKSRPIAALPLSVMLEDVRELLLHRRDRAWDKARHAIRSDWDAALSSLGMHLRAAIGPAIAAADVLIYRLVKSAPKARERHAAEATLTALLAAIRTEVAIRAAWADLLDAMRTDNEDVGTVWIRRAVLADAIMAAGHDVDGVFKLAKGVLDDSAYAVTEAKVLLGRGTWPADVRPLVHSDAGLAAEERTTLVSDLFSSWARTGRCTVWLAFREARLDTCFVEAGSVTFLDAEWAVPNAQASSGQPFPHRAELSRAMHLPDSEKLHGVVLARVDLGVRPVAGAVLAAVDRAEAIVEAASSSRSVGTWLTYGWRMTFVDGTPIGLEQFTPDDELRAWSAPYKLDEVSQSLTDLGSRLGSALATAPLPVELRAALRSARQAHTADSTGRLLHHYRVLELVAAAAGLDEADSLARKAASHWPLTRWRGHCMVVVLAARYAWLHSGEQMSDSVAGAFRDGPGWRFHVDFAAAAVDPSELVRHLPVSWPIARVETCWNPSLTQWRRSSI